MFGCVAPTNGLSNPPGGLLMRISSPQGGAFEVLRWNWAFTKSNDRPYDARTDRSEEHTSELQSQSNLVCRLLLEKKKKNNKSKITNNSRTPSSPGHHRLCLSERSRKGQGPITPRCCGVAGMHNETA